MIDMSELTHAGGVVVRELAGRRWYLLVRSASGKKWVLPKGRIERGESPMDAARREVREETGCVGAIKRPLLRSAYDLPKETVSVLYFLMMYRGPVPKDEEHEERETIWCEPSKARRKLSFEDAQNAIARAERIAAATRLLKRRLIETENQGNRNGHSISASVRTR